MKLFEKMDLFKNKVGRPSNEILKKRKLFYLGVTASVLVVILLAVFTLSNLSLVNLKGAALQSFEKGEEITISNAKVYLTKSIRFSLVRKSGTFYIFNSNIENDRVRIAKKRVLGKRTIYSSVGWVEVSDIKKEISLPTVTSKYSKGDVNKDGKLTKEDATLVQKYVAGLQKLNDEQLYLADFNNDNKVTSTDSRLILNKITSTTTTTTKSTTTVKQTKPLKTDMTLKCPTSVTVNKEGVCTTNMSGVKITVTKTNLNNKYKSTYTTTSSDKTKVFMYTKTGTITVKAEKSGYKSVTKTVKIEKAANTTAATASSSKYSVTSAQYTTLVAVVCQEDSTGYTGAKAVIDTIFNRVDSSSFPNTTWKVVTARKQFAAYWEGHYKRRLNSNGTLKSECNNAKKAVDDAMAKPSNRSHNSLYFQDTKYITKGWTSRQIGANWYRTDSAGTLKK